MVDRHFEVYVSGAAPFSYRVDRDPGLINTEDATQSNHAEKTVNNGSRYK